MNFSTKTLAKILALSAGCSLVTLAQAANTITFTGKVSDTTCTATIDNGVSSIEMGTSSVADLDTNTYGA
ncbi:MAG: type 1 fimbrial protein, partial [Klebsiella michiganensis]|nr:type 1 fimbrial protein [Klebsiella michiganensis]